MGSLVKQHLSKLRQVLPNEIYHVTCMPCYDKKLEASREDFYNDMLHCHDVDCVITASKFKMKICYIDYHFGIALVVFNFFYFT